MLSIETAALWSAMRELRNEDPDRAVETAFAADELAGIARNASRPALASRAREALRDAAAHHPRARVRVRSALMFAETQTGAV
ncbi:hypothetical protein ATO8_09768 [Roseivivax marinus]|uniref:Uncharacterized protein n=1 Tax=Roseivivax marinus TaxID=1379903 RepID=W4HL09_9RHOB|nr:hypothetical protein [Roseivivax marinus]ETW12821.1 hypothetical protein ATO8_09768 [Roseivivax marinus]